MVKRKIIKNPILFLLSLNILLNCLDDGFDWISIVALVSSGIVFIIDIVEVICHGIKKNKA